MHATLTALLLVAAATGHAVTAATLELFQPWSADDWVASDDSIRGGLSESFFQVITDSSASSSSTAARFYGNLDYTALNGSGFASQRTVDDWTAVDLSAYDRLVLEVSASAGDDGKTFSLNLKDTIPATVNGVEQAGVSWEYNFDVSAAAASSETYEQVEVLFADLVPTYRGSVLNDTDPLDLTSIKRVNFMIRRYVLPLILGPKQALYRYPLLTYFLASSAKRCRQETLT